MKRELYIVDGVNLQTEMKRLLRKPVFRHVSDVELVIRNRTSKPQSRYGYAEPWSNTIYIVRWPGLDRFDVCETLLHELVHIKVGSRPGTRRWHGEDFHRAFRQAFREGYKLRPRGKPVAYHGRFAKVMREAAEIVL